MSSETLAIESSGGRPDVAATASARRARVSLLPISPLARWLKVVSSFIPSYIPRLACRRAFTAAGRVHQGSALCLVPHALGAPARPDWAGPPSPSAATDAPERELPANAAHPRSAATVAARRARSRRGGRRRRAQIPTSTPRGRARPRPTGARAPSRTTRAGGYADARCQHPTAFPVSFLHNPVSNLLKMRNLRVFHTESIIWHGGRVSRRLRQRMSWQCKKTPCYCANSFFAARDAQHARSRRPTPRPVAHHGRRRARGRGPPPARRLARAGTSVDRAPLFFRDVPDVGFHLRPLCPLTRPDRGSDARRAPWRRPWSTRASPRRQRTTRTTRSAAFSLTCTPATASP